MVSTGFAVDAKSFASNALASAADVIASVFIALYLVDRISRRERRQKWQRVKKLSYHSIEAICDLIMFAFSTAPGCAALASSPNSETATPEQKPQYVMFSDLGKKIMQEINGLCHMDPIVVDPTIKDLGLGPNISVEHWKDGVITVSDEKRASERYQEMVHEISSQILLAEVAPHLEKLSINVFPRILELDENAELISSFIETESAFQDWSSNVDTIEGDWGMPEEFAWEAAAKFCENVSIMLKVIYDERDN
jgi:hypothetical protein